MSSASSTSSSQLHRWLTAYCSLSLSWWSAWIEESTEASNPLSYLWLASPTSSPGFYSILLLKELEFPGEGDYRPYWLAESPILGIRPSTSHNSFKVVSLFQLIHNSFSQRHARARLTSITLCSCSDRLALQKSKFREKPDWKTERFFYFAKLHAWCLRNLTYRFLQEVSIALFFHALALELVASHARPCWVSQVLQGWDGVVHNAMHVCSQSCCKFGIICCMNPIYARLLRNLHDDLVVVWPSCMANTTKTWYFAAVTHHACKLLESGFEGHFEGLCRHSRSSWSTPGMMCIRCNYHALLYSKQFMQVTVTLWSWQIGTANNDIADICISLQSACHSR